MFFMIRVVTHLADEIWVSGEKVSKPLLHTVINSKDITYYYYDFFDYIYS